MGGKRFLIFFTAMATSVFFHSCEYIQDLGFKNTSVFTIPVSSITSISALTGGVVRAGGESPVKVRGVCWSTEKNPSADLSTRTFDSTAAISFTSHLNNLLPNTVYFVKAYAENSQGVYYGNEISFKTTQPTVPSLISVKPSFITSSSAISGGEIINDGGSLIRSRGVCWSTLDNPTASPGYKTVDSTGTGLYISRVFGLGANKKYYVRAYAVNSVGTAYGDQISFITSPAALAIIKTGFPADITQNTVSVEGNVSDDGGSQVTVRGICWGENPDPTTDKCSKTTNGSGSGNFSAVITGLAAGKKYYARAYAINSPGISYGNPVSFQTGLAGLPVLTTLLPGTIAYSTAQCAGNVISDGGAPVTERGICWSTNENPSILLSTKTIDGTGTGTFACAISGLKASTFYYVRAYATGIAGTGYGSQIIFKTLSPTVPLVSTGLVSEVTLTGAKAEGLVSSDGGVEVSERGICLGTTKNGSVDQDTKIVCGSGTGAFSCSIQRLVPGTTYYLRTYARNSEGISYGNEVNFITVAGQVKQGIGMSNLAMSISGAEVISIVNGWHYYAFTKGADRSGKIYIDGVLVAEGYFNNVGYLYSSLFLGAGYSSEWSGFYKGWLDELRVSGIVRSSGEIHDYYNSNAPFACDANTIGLFHFNEGNGSEIKSASGTTGTLYNGVKFNEGKFSYGLYFDGTDDKGDCNMNIPENNITIEFWAKPEGIQDATIIQPFGFYSSNIYFRVVSGN
jgi:hypothetical protein